MENHHRSTGSGNYNRFAPLVRERLPSKRKRQLPDEALAPDPKTPRLDANTRLRAAEGSGRRPSGGERYPEKGSRDR